MEKIKVGSWMVLVYDEFSDTNVMVKILSKDDNLRLATVEMDLAIRKTDEPKKYITEVNYEDLRQPKLRLKNKKRLG